MNLDFTIDPDDRQRLETIFGSDADGDRFVGIIARAGANELVAQATGRAVFSSTRDLRSHRLFLSLGRRHDPGEAETLVSRQVPAGTARGYVESALAHYDVELKDQVRGRVIEALNERPGVTRARPSRCPQGRFATPCWL